MPLGSPFCCRTILGNGRACAFLCLPPCNRLGHSLSFDQSMSKSLFLHPTSFQNQFSGNIFDAFQSNLPSFSCEAKPKPAPAKYPPLILHTRALLPNFFQYAVLACCSSIFFTSFGQTSFEYQGVSMRPLDTQITGLAHHCSCRSSYLSPHLNFSNLLHPSFSLFMMPDSLCPVLSGQGGKFLLHFEAICFHE